MNTTVYGTAAWSLRDHAQRWSAVMQLLAEEELGQAIKEIEQYAISLPRK